jgi:calcineurin-like phosphoesterase family protein
MDHEIISNIVKRLQKGDDFYYLGDFALTKSKNAMEGYMKALVYTEANLFFIKGNHDKHDTIKLYERYGTYLGEQKKIKIEDKNARGGIQEIVLNHFAMRVWDKSHHGAWHLYGHSHDGLEREVWGKSMDVGAPSAYRILEEYTIFSYQEVKDIMAGREVKVIDHHGKTDRE